MLKKTITFEDLDGNMVTEDFYFNLSKADLIKWELSEKGGFSAHLERALELSRKGDSSIISTLIEELIKRSIGERGADNRTFERHNGEVARRFMETDAYSVLFMEFGTDAKAAADFLTALAPKDMREEVAQEVAKRAETVNDMLGVVAAPAPEGAVSAEVPSDPTPWLTENRDPSSTELRRMTAEQIQDAFAQKEKRLATTDSPT